MSENPFPSAKAVRDEYAVYMQSRRERYKTILIGSVKYAIDRWKGCVMDVVYESETTPEAVQEVIKMLEEQGYKATTLTRDTSGSDACDEKILRISM